MIAIAVRWKALPWILGLCLLAFSFVAANRLLHTQDGNGGAGPDGPPKKDAKAQAPAGTSPNPQGLTVLGQVDAPNGIARVDAPSLPALSGAMVTGVLVQEGQEVKIGDVLLQFDDSAFVAKLGEAEAEWQAAQAEAVQAKALKDDFPKQIELQKLAVERAETELRFTGEGYTRAREAFEIGLKAQQELSEAAKDNARRGNTELLKAEGILETLKLSVKKEKIDLERLQAKPVDAELQRAAAKVARLKATVDNAKAILELAKVKAKVAGVAERVIAQPGRTFGPATREPALYIVPTGARIVRAEVEAEFAHKIVDRLGKKVTICDSFNFGQTYEGRVTRIGTCYLPTRGSAETIAMNPTQVLECEIEVIDPTPAGKPPLRVGQKVRVVFGP